MQDEGQPREPVTLSGTKSPRDLEKGDSPRSQKAEQNYNFKQIMGLKCVPGL